MCSFRSIYFVIFILNLYGAYSEISDKRLCVDPQCNEPVSLARTLLRYSSPDPMILSFAPNTEATIYSKEAGSETNLWGAVIKGKRGYIPKHLVREHKVFKKPTLLVDTELKQKPQVPKEGEKSVIDPDNVKKPYEVVDGTTIYLNPQDKIEPSTTEAPILATSLPPATNEDKQPTPVDSPKEKEAPVKQTAEESVVDNVLSSLSNWMNDEDSEEVEDEEEDDDEDDEDEEEDSLEQHAENSLNKSEETTKNAAQDINLLHNLSKGVKISPYNLEVSQDTSKEEDLERKETPPKLKDSESTADAKTAEDTQKETIPSRNDVAEDSTPPQEAVPIKSEEIVGPAIETDSSVNVDEAAAAPPEKNEPELTNVTQGNESAEKPEQIESENADPLVANADSVTEPSVDIEVPVPILDVTTPNPLDLKGQENLQSEPSSQTAEEKSEAEPSVRNEEKVPYIPMPDNIAQVPTTDKPVLGESPVADVKEKESAEAVTEDGSKLAENNSEINQQYILSGNSTDTVSEEDASKGPYESEVEIPKSTEEKAEVATSDASDETNDVKAEQTIINDEPADENFLDLTQEQTHNEGVESSSEVPLEEVSVPPLEEVTKAPSEVYEAPSQEVTEAPLEEVAEILSEVTEAPSDEVTEASPQEVNEEPNASSSEEVSEIREEEQNAIQSEEVSESAGIWSGLFSFFDSSSSAPSEEDPVTENKAEENVWVPQHLETVQSGESYCDASSESCNTSQQDTDTKEYGVFDNIDLKFNSDFFVLLITTAGSVIVFLIIYMALDRSKREAPLVARINKLEKELLVTLKENELLQENGTSAVQEVRSVPDEVVEQLTQRLAEAHQTQRVLEERLRELEIQLEAKAGLEEQIESLEKELETSTEVGMELNRIISEMLDPTNGSDRLKENMEQLQRQLLEQKDTINSISETLREKEDENRTLRGDLEKSKKVATDLQNKLDEMVERILKIERERDQQHNTLQNEISVFQQKYKEAVGKEGILNSEIQVIRTQLSEAQRTAEIKTKEYQTLRESLDKIKALKNDGEALKSLLDATSIKAEIQQLKAENVSYATQLQQEQAVKAGFEKKYQAVMEEMALLKQKYEQADKEKVEVNAKLDVLNNYFKKRESELQEEIIRYKSIWDAKEGEATSTTERIKYMQEEIENYKAQNETLKQEIISQEIELKSQISVLEKKVHENWVTSRQTERKLEDARQEAAQLRNRLTLRERAINEERVQNIFPGLQSPVEQNGELPLSPHPMDSPASPPLLYGGRDHITKSPPIPGMPPFLPPPPGAPFMPPPLHGMPPFMPPLPSMFPGDHRPPPLGRMSSPPLNSRYSPDSSAFSPYDRRSPSPPYDSEYGASPPPMRGYSPYNGRDDRRDYKRQPHGRSNGRNAKGPVMSSGSDHSNDSLDKMNRKQSKMV